MANIQIPIPETIQTELEKMILDVAREAIATAKEQDSSYGKEWLKQAEACKWLNISYVTLQSWRAKGLKIATIQGITLVSKKEINRFLSEHQI